MLAMEVNDDARSLTPRGALSFFASMLAPTGPSAIHAGLAKTRRPYSRPDCRSVCDVIVPTRSKGMPPGTLRVPLTTH
jgi:hypothetical protein